VNLWPVAYSKFLRLISVFTHSDVSVVFVQYFILQASSLVFLFTFLYFLRPIKGIAMALQVFFLFNPILLYVANYISADALFIGLSMLWFSSLIWIIFRPARWVVVVQAILLLACFTVRYNAMYYPLIAALAYFFSRQSWKTKLAGIGLGTVLVAFSLFYTSNKMYKETGKWQFSAFGGWQLANNALYMYQHIPEADRKPVPARFAKLEAMVKQHMDTLERVYFSHDDSVNAYFYLWSGKGPLVQYMLREYKNDNKSSYFKKWASEGPLFSAYASWLIRQYPLQFIRYFALPNSIKYAAPPGEFLDKYNMGLDSVKEAAKDWFNYKTGKVAEQHFFPDQIGIPQWYVALSAMANIVFVLGLLSLWILKAIRWKDDGFTKMIVLVLIFWCFNTGFSLFASPIVMRYQLFPIMLFISFALLTMGKLYKLSDSSSGGVELTKVVNYT
jgi:hypothetical protein